MADAPHPLDDLQVTYELMRADLWARRREMSVPQTIWHLRAMTELHERMRAIEKGTPGFYG